VNTVMLPLSLACVLITVASGQPPNPKTKGSSSSSIRGVWRQVEATSANGEISKSNLPSLAIFTDRYYALMEITGERPAPAPGEATDADKLKLYDTLLANSGTYEFDGTTVTRHAQIAKNQAVIGSAITSQVAVSGNRFVETITDGRNKGKKFTYERVE
jgi:Lipocalin-like domain